jgi:hypothetical protein
MMNRFYFYIATKCKKIKKNNGKLTLVPIDVKYVNGIFDNIRLTLVVMEEQWL